MVGNFADLTVEGTLTAPTVAGMGGFVDMPATTIRNTAPESAEPDGSFRWDYYRSLDPEIVDDDGDFSDMPFRWETPRGAQRGRQHQFGPRRLGDAVRRLISRFISASSPILMTS